MSAAKHTAGPWGTRGSHDYEITDSTAYLRIFEKSTRIMPAERLANARLIATAPELLEALKELMQAFGGVESHAQQAKWDKAKTAIAKAEGGGQ